MKKGIDHPQYSRLSYTVLTVQKGDSIVQVEIDMMVIDSKQPVDLDALEPKKLMFPHCYAPLMPVSRN